MEDTLGVPPQLGDPVADWAAYYAADRRWEVLAGHPLLDPPDGSPPGSAPRCGCGEPACARPGDHPIDQRGAAAAVAGPTAVRRQWRETPEAAVLLPTGRAFDALEVPEEAGCLALARMGRTGVEAGPVLSVPRAERRMRFLVQAGGAEKLGGLLRAGGWPPSRLDLGALGEGEWVLAPPGRVGVFGPVRWVVEPSAENLLLPGVEQVLGAVAYACGTAARLPRPRSAVAPGAGGQVRRRPSKPARPPG